MPARILFFSALFLLLSACSTLSEQECRNGDWRAIGYRDGQNGRPLARLDEHRKACAEFGIGPKQSLYEEGRERGLSFYCTPSNALAVGRRGEHYANVCPARMENSFLNNYEIGRDIYSARQRLERLENEQRDVEQRLRKANSKDEVRHLTGQMSRLRMERDFAWDELRRREDRADRLRF